MSNPASVGIADIWTVGLFALWETGYIHSWWVVWLPYAISFAILALAALIAE